MRSLSCYVCVCECNYSTLLVTPWLQGMAFYYHLFTPFTWVRVTSSTRAQSRAQSRGTRTLVRRDTSDNSLISPGMLGSLRTLLSYSSGRAFGRGDLMSHITGYSARSRDRLCDHHTVTATRLPPHSHCHMVTATRSPPHDHCHTATATLSPPHSPATFGRVMCRVTYRVMW